MPRMTRFLHTGRMYASITCIPFLCRIFREHLGISPQEFLITFRLRKAVQLLRTTKLSIKDIGNAAGYPNQLHFSRAFKNVYGMSPKQWRSSQKLAPVDELDSPE